MPIGRSAKKSLRKSVKHRKVNVSFKNKLKTIVKRFLAKPTEKSLSEVSSILDKAQKNHLIHRNKVSRLKSNMSKKVGKEVKAAVKVKKAVKKKPVRKVTKKMS